MKIKSIDDFAKQLAKEISERPSFDIEEIVTLIAVRVNDAMMTFVGEHSINLEKEYQALLKEARTYKINTPKYIDIGYRIAEIKSKKSLANRAHHNVDQDQKYYQLQKFIKEKYGNEAMIEFYEKLSTMVVQKSSSHSIINPMDSK